MSVPPSYTNLIILALPASPAAPDQLDTLTYLTYLTCLISCLATLRPTTLRHYDTTFTPSLPHARAPPTLIQPLYEVRSYPSSHPRLPTLPQRDRGNKPALRAQISIQLPSSSSHPPLPPLFINLPSASGLLLSSCCSHNTPQLLAPAARNTRCRPQPQPKNPDLSPSLPYDLPTTRRPPEPPIMTGP